jgi:hypothetical protein
MRARQLRVVVYALYRQHGSFAAGAVVIAAGAYEFTSPKAHFGRRCRESFRSGFAFGFCCVGSCIGLMLVQLALAVMSIIFGGFHSASPLHLAIRIGAILPNGRLRVPEQDSFTPSRLRHPPRSPAV